MGYEIEKLFSVVSRPCKTLDFPGPRGESKDGSPKLRVALWALTHGETRAAHTAALVWLIKGSGLSVDHLAHDAGWLLEDEKKVQILFRALRDPEQPERAFAPTVEMLRDGLTSDELQSLFNEYLTWLDARSPLRRVETPEELDALVNSLGKGLEDETSLVYYDSVSLRRIVRSLAVRLVKLTRESSSSSLSLSATSGS